MGSEWTDEGHRAIARSETLKTSTVAFSPLLSHTTVLSIYYLFCLIFPQFYIPSSALLPSLTDT